MSSFCRRLPGISVLILAVTLLLSLILTAAPVTANGPITPPSLEIDPHPTITATVSTQFTIQIWIRNIPAGYKLTELDFIVSWDSNQMDFVRYQEFKPPNWSVLGRDLESDHYFLHVRAYTPEDATDLEMAWASITFHCIAEGASKITLSTASTNANTIILYDGESYYNTSPDPFVITVNQFGPRPVGGVALPTNKLEIVAPFAALAGLVAVVSAVVAVKRRSKT